MDPASQVDIVRLEKFPADVKRWQEARNLLHARRPSAALSIYRQLTQRYPGVPHLWIELATALAKELEFPAAMEALKQAAGLAVNDSALLILIGQEFHRLRRPDDARAAFERAVQTAPASVHARLSLAAWHERDRRLDDAWTQTDQALQIEPGSASARYYKAFIMHRQGRNAEAESLLRDLVPLELSPEVKISALHLLAVVLDALGNYSEALKRLLASKAILRQTANAAALEQACDKADFRRRKLLAELTPGMIGQWRSEPGPPLPYGLALLAGHPRSGTTLLEQILGAHPSINAIDEAEAFVAEIADPLTAPSPAPALNARGLAALSPQRALLRARYWKSLLREGAPAAGTNLILDKNPNVTGHLHLWLRFLPESKIVVALRDPRDVVISCFFQNLPLTPLSVNFLSLERTVQHYSGLMDVWLRTREVGGFDWLESRYEDVVANLESEGRRVTEFLGLSWDAAQARFHEAARKKMVFAPTYHDVTHSVHSRAMGRWRHYAEALEKVQPNLRPYLDAFGYTA